MIALIDFNSILLLPCLVKRSIHESWLCLWTPWSSRYTDQRSYNAVQPSIISNHAAMFKLSENHRDDRFPILIKTTTPSNHWHHPVYFTYYRMYKYRFNYTPININLNVRGMCHAWDSLQGGSIPELSLSGDSKKKD